MQISNNNTIKFGEARIDKKAIDALGNMLHKKAVEGESVFVKNFRTSLEKCKDTKFADLVVTSDKRVFVEDKVSKNRKEIKSFNSLLNNVYTAIKHVIFAEENRFHF